MEPRIDEVLETKALRRVIAAFVNYSGAAEEDVSRWERSFSKLPSQHQDLVSHLPDKHAQIRKCVAANFQVIRTVLQNFEPPYGMEEADEAEQNGFQNGKHTDCKSHRKQYDEIDGWRCKNADIDSCEHATKKRIAVENGGTRSAVGVQSSYEDAPDGQAQEVTLAFGAPQSQDWFESLRGLHVLPADIEKVRCVLRNIVRDWSEEGFLEREKCYKPILEELQRLFPSIDKARPPSCLVPGAGLGRLCLEISRLGFISQGNEFSYYMLIFSSFILNDTLEPFEYTIHPWIHNSCNKVRDSEQLHAVRFPDLHPGSAGITEGFSMCAGDFVEVYSHPNQKGAWDAVVTCFFIDTAHNILEYIEVISKILKPGGAWINLGPLLYHFSDPYICSLEDEMSIELSLESVKKAALSYGFEIQREATVESTYTACPFSMMQTQYRCAFWTMIKGQ